MCDPTQRYVQKLNMTTGVYFVMVLTGTLPAGNALRGLTHLTEIDIRTHHITGMGLGMTVLVV